MKIISHRGFWKDPNQKNQLCAFEESFRLNLGVETDIRDYQGKLVISHDIPDNKSLSLEKFFQTFKEYDSSLTLALNIKADGLQKPLRDLLTQYKINNYFVFDMSVPEAVNYIKYGISFFSRLSEFETSPLFLDECQGIWIDGFNSTWYNMNTIIHYANNSKRVAIVSPELHNREYLPLWAILKKLESQIRQNIILCTDYPDKALEFFAS